MRLERVTDYSELRTGDSVICRIAGVRIRRCKVYVDEKCAEVPLYFCQNEKIGRDCGVANRQGFNHSWAVARTSRGFMRDVRAEGISGLRKIVKEGT